MGGQLHGDELERHPLRERKSGGFKVANTAELGFSRRAFDVQQTLHPSSSEVVM